MLRKLIEDDIIEEFNRGIPATCKYTANPGGISRYNELKVYVLSVQNIGEKNIRKNLWQYKFSAMDFSYFSDKDLFNVYQSFSMRKNRQM